MADITIRIRNAIDQSIGRTLDVIENRAVGAAGSLERLENRMSSLARNQRRAVQGTHELIRQLHQLNATVNTNSGSLNNFNSSIASSAISIGALGISFSELISQTSRLSDEIVSLENRISFFSDPNISGNSEALFDGIFESANRARVGVNDFSKTFFRIDRAFKEIGFSQAEALAGTEAITKALALSGATTGETSSALLQLSQAFNKGKLDGDEFRSVMENAPLFVDQLAKSLNVTSGELLNLAPLGKITTNTMAEALVELSNVVDKEFNSTTVTVGQSLNILRNNILKSMSDGRNLTKLLSGAILSLSENVEILKIGFIALGTVLSALALRSFVNVVISLSSSFIVASQSLATFTGLTVLIQGVTLSFTGLLLVVRRLVAVFAIFTASFKITQELMKAFPEASEKLTSSLSSAANKFLAFIGVAEDWEKAGELATASTNATAKSVDGLRKAINKPIVSDGVKELNKEFKKTKTELDEINQKIKDLASPNIEGTEGQINSMLDKLEKRKLELEVVLKGDDLNNIGKNLPKIEIPEIPKIPELSGFEKEYEDIANTAIDSFIKIQDRSKALNQAFKDKIITARQFKKEISELELEKLELEFEATGLDSTRQKIDELRNEIQGDEARDNFYETLRSSGVGALAEIRGEMEALNKAREDGLIGQNKFLELQQQLGNEELGLKIELFGTEQQQAAFAFIEQFKVSMEEVRQIGINAFSNISQGIGSATADLLLMQTQALLTGKSADGAFTSFKETLSDLGKNVLKQILSSFVQLGIQFLVNKALTKIFKLDIEDLNKKQSEAARENRKNILTNTALAVGSMVTTKAIGTATGKALAQAYTPAAAAASLASFGANSIPAIAGIAATSAKANAAFGSGSFQEGGFTGNVATNRVAGVVHGQEFVVNAQNTARNRGLLEAMNRGFDAQSALRNSNLSPSVDLSRLRQVAPSNAPAANGGMMNNIDVVIENNIAGAEFEVTQDQDDRIRIIARQEAENSIRNNVPDLVAGELANPNSSVSSSLSSNTTAERRRA